MDTGSRSNCKLYGELKMIKIINIDENAERLAKLKQFLSEELKCSDPSMLYVQDLKESIERLNKTLEKVN